MLRITLGLTFRDTQCGFKAFTRRARKQFFRCRRWNAGASIPNCFTWRRSSVFKIAEVPVAWAHSEGTRISPLRDGIRMFAEMLKIRWNALTGKYSPQKVR